MREDDGRKTPTQAALSRKALETVQQADVQGSKPENEPHRHGGAEDLPANTPRPDQAPSGALDAEGHRPVLERSRKVR